MFNNTLCISSEHFGFRVTIKTIISFFHRCEYAIHSNTFIRFRIRCNRCYARSKQVFVHLLLLIAWILIGYFSFFFSSLLFRLLCYRRNWNFTHKQFRVDKITVYLVQRSTLLTATCFVSVTEMPQPYRIHLHKCYCFVSMCEISVYSPL